jgi:hypothetical protein
MSQAGTPQQLPIVAPLEPGTNLLEQLGDTALDLKIKECIQASGALRFTSGK